MTRNELFQRLLAVCVGSLLLLFGVWFFQPAKQDDKPAEAVESTPDPRAGMTAFEEKVFMDSEYALMKEFYIRHQQQCKADPEFRAYWDELYDYFN